MIEMRWVEMNDHAPPHAMPIKGQDGHTYRVLQYREGVDVFGVPNTLEQGVEAVLWTEWRDVKIDAI